MRAGIFLAACAVIAVIPFKSVSGLRIRCHCRLDYVCSDTPPAAPGHSSAGAVELMGINAGPPPNQAEALTGQKKFTAAVARGDCALLCQGRGEAAVGYLVNTKVNVEDTIRDTARDWLAKALNWKNVASAGKCCAVFVAHKPSTLKGEQHFQRIKLTKPGDFKYYKYTVSTRDLFTTSDCTAAELFPTGLQARPAL